MLLLCQIIITYYIVCVDSLCLLNLLLFVYLVYVLLFVLKATVKISSRQDVSREGKVERGMSITELLLVTNRGPFGKQFPNGESPTGDEKTCPFQPYPCV